MKKNYCAVFIMMIINVTLFGAPSFSGVLDSTFSARLWDKEPAQGTFTLEEYLNLRMQAKIGSLAAFYSAFNFIASAGENAALLGLNTGANFAAAIELERLYLRFTTEHTGLDIGLFRQAFGYGQIWGPMDFLNSRNPLLPDARPRAILGAAYAVFPGDTSKILAFVSAPKDPVNAQWNGAFTGIATEKHSDKFSIQALYSYETPHSLPQSAVDYTAGIHRGGLSLKADVVAGIFADALYKLNPHKPSGLDSFAVSCGADYSFGPREPNIWFQSLIVMTSYLYSGANSEMAFNEGGIYRQEHYLYPSVQYNMTNYTSLSAAAIIALEDGSFAPVLSFQQSIAQGLDLTVNAQFYPCQTGEFGRTGVFTQAAALSAKLSARF
ncbi:MAG: hypothetical protein LBD22_02680 [Spirochaetaceae bacterium]|jgi:hypothetical protein|nr:hypothetical protein [Spirochaetaceae bacterium]